MLFCDTLCTAEFLDFKYKKIFCRPIVEIKVRKLST